MKCHEISGILGSKALTKRGCSLGLVHGLKAHEGTPITHRDTCSLSSLKERGTIDISRARVLL